MRSREDHSQPSWRHLKLEGDALRGCWGHSVCLHQGNLYVYGGITAEEGSQDITCISLNTRSCRKVRPSGHIPEPHDSHTATVHGNRMYVIGGSDKLDEVYVLQLDSYEWSILEVTGAKQSVPREGHSAVLLGNNIVLFGGNTSTGGQDLEDADGAITSSADEHGMRYLNDVCCLDLNTSRWSKPAVKGPVPRARDSHAAAVWNNKMIIYGGDCGEEYLADVWEFDLVGMKWRELQVTNSSGPGPRAGHLGISTPAGIAVFGGTGQDGNFFNDCWILKVGPDAAVGLQEGQAAWLAIPRGQQLPEGRFAHGGAYDKGAVFIVGGCGDGDLPLDDVQVLVLDPNSPYSTSPALPAQAPPPYTNGLQHQRNTGACSPSPAMSVGAVAGEETGRGTGTGPSGAGPHMHDPSSTPFVVSLPASPSPPAMLQNAGPPHSVLCRDKDSDGHRLEAARQQEPRLEGRPTGPPANRRDAEESAGVGPKPTSKKRNGMREIADKLVKPASRTKIPRRTPTPSPSSQPTCTVYTPNPSLLGAQLEGQIDGCFSAGYLATVNVNGFVYRAVLFSPFLALTTPIPGMMEPAASGCTQEGMAPPPPT